MELTCSFCDGTGRIHLEHETGEERLIDCPDCKGSGKIREPKRWDHPDEQRRLYMYICSHEACGAMCQWLLTKADEERMMQDLRTSSFFQCPACKRYEYIDPATRRMME